jgi:hypothetical protein
MLTADAGFAGHELRQLIAAAKLEILPCGGPLRR